MRKVTTIKDLEITVKRINEAAGTPLEPYKKRPNGVGSDACIGCYYLDGAYGGWKLVQIQTIGGGTRDVTSGFAPKRELLREMHAFLAGLEASRG